MRMTLMSLALVAAITAHAPAGASQQPRPAAQDRKVIIIIADTATWEEYTSRRAPFMGKWLRECAVGSMNTRVQGLPTAPAAYLTLGAGSRAAAELNPELAEFALNNDERYGDVPGRDLFHARTGERLPPGGVGYLGLPLVTRENGEAMYPLRLGLMGQALRRAGLKAAAIGNADVGDRCRRQVVTIVMDEAGIVPLGDVGPEMHTPPMFSQPTVVTEGVNSECWSRPQPDAGRRAMERQAPRLPNWTDTAEGGCAPYGYATPDQQNSLTPPGTAALPSCGAMRGHASHGSGLRLSPCPSENVRIAHKPGGAAPNRVAGKKDCRSSAEKGLGRRAPEVAPRDRGSSAGEFYS